MLEWLKNLWYKPRKTGLIPQPTDSRDYIYKDTPVGDIVIGVDLRERFPIVTDQNGYNSCTYHAVCALLDYELKYNKKHVSWQMNTSEAFLWYYGRKRLGTQNQNSGTVLRDAFKVIKEYGFVPQTKWDYDKGIYTEPTPYVKNIGSIYQLYVTQIPGYFSIFPSNTKSVVNALDNGHPVVFGMFTDKNYLRLNSENPYVDNIESQTGAHAQIIVGYTYKNNILYFIVRNSYGRRWGDNGYAYLNESVIKKAFDLWTLSL